MSFIYSLVARKQVVLCEFTEVAGNFQTITRVVLKKIATNPDQTASKCTFVYDKHRYHYLLHDELIYLCMTDMEIKTTQAFLMLDEIKTRFLKQYEGRGKNAIAYAMTEFSRDLKEIMKTYEENKGVDRYGQVRDQINSVKNIMVQNIDKVLERGEKIDMLVDKTQNLQNEAFKFENQSKKLKNVMWWKKIKLNVILFILAIVLLWLISSMICGFDYGKCRSRGENLGGNSHETGKK